MEAKPKMAVPLSDNTKMLLRMMTEEEEEDNKRNENDLSTVGWRYLKGLDDKMVIDTERDILKKNV